MVVFTNGTIQLTNREDLKKLMSLEFHGNDGSYNSHEPDYFLKRLQKNNNLKNFLFGRMVKPGITTALIIFGDGFIERSIGGGSSYPEKEKYNDVIRPNTSLSLFLKDNSGNVELVFYSRFLSINYSHDNELGKKIRAECKKLDVETDPRKKNDLKNKIFLDMSKLDEIKIIKDVNKPPKERDRYHFAISSHKSGAKYDASDQDDKPSIGVPWIRLWDKNRKEPRIIQFYDYGKTKSTIHGTHDTARCWMFLRNFSWNWPREDVDNKYIKLTKAYLLWMKKGAYDNEVQNAVKNALGSTVAPSENEIFYENCNYAYFTFLRYFAGLRYTKHSDIIKFPKQIYHVVQDNKNNKEEFKTNLVEKVNDFWKGETLKFFNGTERTVEKYDGKDKFIKIKPELSDKPTSSSTFVLGNCWNARAGVPEWGPTILNQNPFGFNRFWANVFIFKVSGKGEKNFTPDPGDDKKFE